jgi:hypothetical protein
MKKLFSAVFSLVAAITLGFLFNSSTSYAKKDTKKTAKYSKKAPKKTSKKKSAKTNKQTKQTAKIGKNKTHLSKKKVIKRMGKAPVA